MSATHKSSTRVHRSFLGESRKLSRTRRRGKWCRCEHAVSRVTFHDYNPRSRVSVKPHWTCDDCGGVTQVN